jgi:hypothetical protein
LKRRPAASTMRCRVACFWSLLYRIANLSCRTVRVQPLHYARTIVL